jgi:thiamine biosynthesis lipoprotein
MGTVLQVTVIADDAQRAKRLAEECIAEARRWDDVLTTWRSEGELARLNRKAGKGEVPISDQLAAALGQMLAFSKETGGAFDPAVGPWVDWWRTPSVRPPGLGNVPALDRVLRVGRGHASLARGAALDAGAIGKAIAVDAMVRLLRAGAARAAFVDFGGSSLHAFGAPEERPEGWAVGISGLSPNEILGTVDLRDASLATSRSTGAGEAAGPIVDPRSGRAVEERRLAVVLSPNATVADVWSTALVVLGRDGVPRAEANGVEVLYADGAGALTTAGFAQKLRPPT